MAVVAVLLVTGLAGCSGSNSADPLAAAASVTSAMGVADTAVPDASEMQESAESGDSDPVADREEEIRNRYLADGDRDMEAVARTRSELIGSCMRLQGFEYIDYVPVIPPQDTTATNPYGWDLDIEQAEESGYGLIVNLEETRRYDTIRQFVDMDPNTQIRAELSLDERLEYDITWIGQPLSPTPEELGEIPPGTEVNESGIPVDWAKDLVIDETGGCKGAANREVFGPELTLEETDALQDVDSRTEGDPEVVEAEKAWSTCMAREGYSLGGFVDIIGEIDKLLWGALEASTVENEEIDVRDLTVSVPIEHFDDEILQALAKEEILLAVADSTCRTESEFTDIYGRVLRRVTEEALNSTFDASG